MTEGWRTLEIIVYVEFCNANAELYIAKDKDLYVVQLTENAIVSEMAYKDLTAAYKVFEKLSSWLIFGFYDENRRREYLLNGTME